MLRLQHMIFVFITLSVYVHNHFNSPSPIPSPSPTPPSMKVCSDLNLEVFLPQFSYVDTIQILLVGFSMVLSLTEIFFHICSSVKFVPFNIDLSNKVKQTCATKIHSTLFLSLATNFGVLLSEHVEFWSFLLCYSHSSLSPQFRLHTKTPRFLSRLLFIIITIQLFSLSNTVGCDIISILALQNCFIYSSKMMPSWLLLLLILLSNDVHQNPGPINIRNSYLTFMNWNCNSLAMDDFRRLRLIEAQNSVFDYDLISLCETSLNDQVALPDEYFNDEYMFIPANKPDNTRHGGVGLLYKKSLPLKIRNDLSFNECIVAEVKYGRKKIFFTVLYRSPSFKHTSQEFADFTGNFTELYNEIKSENPYMTLFTGDFNGHSQSWYPDGNTTPEGAELESLFTSLGLNQIIKEPTNFQPGCSPSCIDLIVTDQPNLMIDSGTRPSLDQNCHHQIIHGKINFKLPPAAPYERKYWYYQRADEDSIQRSMSYFPWDQQLNLNSDPNWQAKEFTKYFLNIMSNFIPNETKMTKPRDNPWINKTLKAMINKKNRLYKNYKRHGYQENDKIRLDNFRIEVQQAVDDAKKAYVSSLGNKLHNQGTNGKAYWRIINNVLNRSKAPKIPPLLIDNKFIIDCKEKASLFTKFFCKQCTTVLSNSVLPPLTYRTNSRMDSFPISSEDIIKIIQKLNPNKATGSDRISAQMLILCGDTAAIPLKILFNNILSTGVYPNLWKLANITPIHKKDDKQKIINYRPISLLPICGKILEKIIFNQLYTYLTNNDLITKNQSGFRPGDSTTNQLLDLVDTIHKSFDTVPTMEVRAVFLDISKAFDKVWHEGLLFKLKQNGVAGKLLDLFEDYLKNRKQRVVLNGSAAEYESIQSGVPQGSVLGPLLFLIYINDLEENIKSQIRFFADDTMLFSVVQNPTSTANELNQDLETIRKWAHQWKLEFNPDPTKQASELLFSTKRNTPDHPPLHFNGSVITKVGEQKHLGVTLDKKLTFQSHIAEKISKTKKTIGIIKHVSKYLPLKTLILIYKSLVRPHFDYCDTIFHVPPPTNGIFDNHAHESGILPALMKKVESVQYQAALAITGSWQGTNRVKIYEQLGLESLSDRRSLHRILQIFKIKSNLTPSYLKSKLPPLDVQANQNANTIQDVTTRTSRYKNTFFPNAVSTWNNVIANVRGNQTKSRIKMHILKIIRPQPKSIFGIHDPIGIHYLFQLRTGLSPLRSHKYRHNFHDTPDASCNCRRGVEDEKHFLFDCLNFARVRVTLAAKVLTILTKHNLVQLANNVDFYIYGHPSVTLDDNKKVLLATIQYIKSTERFKNVL